MESSGPAIGMSNTRGGWSLGGLSRWRGPALWGADGASARVSLDYVLDPRALAAVRPRQPHYVLDPWFHQWRQTARAGEPRLGRGTCSNGGGGAPVAARTRASLTRAVGPISMTACSPASSRVATLRLRSAGADGLDTGCAHGHRQSLPDRPGTLCSQEGPEFDVFDGALGGPFHVATKVLFSVAISSRSLACAGYSEGYAHPRRRIGEGGRIDMKRQAQSRVSVLLAIMAAGAFVSFAFGQPSTNAAPQSNFVGGEPSRPDSSDMRALRLRFEAGVRSNWHSHAGWQILAAEEGRGRTQARDGEMIEMVPGGRAVLAPAGLVHWHGASPDEHVVQLTVLGGGDGGPTSWFGPVSEEEYRGQ